MNNLNTLKMVELYKIASELKIKSYKKLNKVLLVDAITYAQKGIDNEGNDVTLGGAHNNSHTSLYDGMKIEFVPEFVEMMIKGHAQITEDMKSGSVVITPTVIEETIKQIVAPSKNETDKPLSFRFDGDRANVGDRFMKRMGESSYIPMKVIGKDEANIMLQTRSGIKIKIKNKKGS
jgi:hypothetical protein